MHKNLWTGLPTGSLPRPPFDRNVIQLQNTPHAICLQTVHTVARICMLALFLLEAQQAAESLSDLVFHKTQTSDADALSRIAASASGRWYPKALDPPRSDEECIDYYRVLCSNSVKKFARCSDFTCPTISRTGHFVFRFCVCLDKMVKILSPRN